MNEASQTRLVLARKNAATYRANPNIKALLLTGSVAQGRADDYSDIDTVIYYDPAPTEAEFEAAGEAAMASGGGIYGGTAQQGFVVYEYIDGIRCDFAHSLVHETEALIQKMLAEPDLDDLNQQMIVAGFLEGIPLYGEDWIKGWQAQLAHHYPAELGPAMVKKYLKFHPRWVLEKMGVERGDTSFCMRPLSWPPRTLSASYVG